MAALRWRTFRNERNPDFWTKGAELEGALYGRNSRFMIVAYRVYLDREYKEPDRRYRVRDAHGVSDAEVKDGKRPPIVGDFATEALAVAFCDSAE